MNLIVIFSLAGIVLGAVSLGHSGWLIGGGLGFLLGQGLHLANRLKAVERELRILRHRSDKAVVHGAVEEVSASTDEDRGPIPPTPQSDTPLASPPPAAAEPRAARAEQARPEPTSRAHTSVTPPTAAHTPQPRPEYPIDKFFAAVGRFFTQGNPIVRVGMVVMFFGLSFLAKYASSEGLFPIELRLTAIAAVAIGLMVLGWKTRGKKNGYGLVLQGGGIAALYLTVFAATKIYPLLPSGFAFGLMFVIVMLGAALAVLQNAQVLALMATAGGFLAPILTSDGSGNHVGLFSFYLLLNLGVLAIAWFKTWRLLNWVGFVFTFVITAAWGVLRYEPHLYGSTQPFLLAFFALYLTVAVLFSLKQPPKLAGLVDGSLIFGLPIVGFGLQTALLRHTEYGLAISAVALSAIYIGLARLLWSDYQQSRRMLVESFIALGVTFATLAIPLALDAEWTSATWALEASGLVWVGLRQQRLLPRAAGYLLYVAAAGSLLVSGGFYSGSIPIVSGDFIGLFILAASALCTAYLLRRHIDSVIQIESAVEWIAIAVGLVWWLIAGFIELAGHVSLYHQFAGTILFVSLTTLAVLRAGRQLNWERLTLNAYGLLPLIALLAVSNLVWSLFSATNLHPSQGIGLLALAVFGAVQYRFLWQRRESAGQILVSAYHVATAWLLLLLLFWEAIWWLNHNNWSGTSVLVLWFVCIAGPLVLLMALTKKPVWPFAQYWAAYKQVIPAPLMVLLLLWFVETSSYSGSTGQLYLPLLNPLDLAQFGAVLVVGYAIRYNFLRLALTSSEVRYGILGLAGFVWLNVALLRAIHHYADVAYTAPALWNAVTVQMALSILWTLCALLVMGLSRRKQERNLWLIGAGLLALVLLKLFTKDLTGTGTLARIVSFMAVGGLMLTIGYLSPIPVSKKTISKSTEEAAP